MYLRYSGNHSKIRTISKLLCIKYKKLPQIFAAFAATLSAFGMGTVEAYTSPALPDMEKGPLGPFTHKEYANVAAFALMAAVLSGIPTGILLEKMGRKGTIMFIAVPFVTGWLLIAFAVNLEMVDIGRILTGFCAGSASMSVPVFLGEVAEDEIRGFLGSTFQFQVTAGNLFVYILGKYLGWQWLALSCSFVILVGLLLMGLVPPSPRFLLSKGRVEDAARSLVWLRGAETVEQIENELYAIKTSVELSASEKGKFRDYFRLPVLRPLFISLLLLFFQQMTGVEAVLVYTLDIFRYSRSVVDHHTSVIIVGSLQMMTTLLSAFMVDKVGRKILLLISSLGCSLAMAVLGFWFYHLKQHLQMDIFTVDNDSIAYDWLPLCTLGFFIVSFALGLGPIPFIMITELNSLKMITIASALSTTFNWTFAYLVTDFFLLFARDFGFHNIFWGFAGLSVVGTVLIFIIVPETSGKSMDQIQKYFKA